MIEALFLHEAADNRQPFVFWDGQPASPSFPKALPKTSKPCEHLY
jgi:hypothetical protein